MDQPTIFSKQDYNVIEHEPLYRGFFKLSVLKLRHKKFDGTWTPVLSRECFELSESVSVLPYDPIQDRVVLIEQFRVGALERGEHPWLIEIASGLFMENEKPREAALRETKEETGCTLLDLELIHDYFGSPGCTNEYVHLFCGRTDSTGIQGIHGVVAEDEDIRVLVCSTDQAFELLEKGRVKTAPAMLALQWLQIHRDRLKAKWQKK
jgi:ADP-ribose pyrophosphatase